MADLVYPYRKGESQLGVKLAYKTPAEESLPKRKEVLIEPWLLEPYPWADVKVNSFLANSVLLSLLLLVMPIYLLTCAKRWHPVLHSWVVLCVIGFCCLAWYLISLEATTDLPYFFRLQFLFDTVANPGLRKASEALWFRRVGQALLGIPGAVGVLVMAMVIWKKRWRTLAIWVPLVLVCSIAYAFFWLFAKPRVPEVVHVWDGWYFALIWGATYGVGIAFCLAYLGRRFFSASGRKKKPLRQ